jgi:hypothetical protein
LSLISPFLLVHLICILLGIYQLFYHNHPAWQLNKIYILCQHVHNFSSIEFKINCTFANVIVPCRYCPITAFLACLSLVEGATIYLLELITVIFLKQDLIETEIE